MIITEDGAIYWAFIFHQIITILGLQILNLNKMISIVR